MCGIVGAFDLKIDAQELRANVLKMSKKLRHRGPDWSGIYCGEKAIIAHERLSIVDPESGGQPLYSKDKSLILGVNGEIYNHLEIRKELIKNNLPIFGICLGHQILALALGAKTKKMKLGHRGANHPVKNLIHDNVEITSQNHGFAVDAESLPVNIRVSHISLFDQSLQGIEFQDTPAFSFQGHPEASPGPQEIQILFSKFKIHIFLDKCKKYTV